MALLAQKYKELPRFPGTDGNLLFFRGQRDRWSPHNKLLKGPWSLHPIRAQTHRFVDSLSSAALAIAQRSRLGSGATARGAEAPHGGWLRPDACLSTLPPLCILGAGIGIKYKFFIDT